MSKKDGNNTLKLTRVYVILLITFFVVLVDLIQHKKEEILEKDITQDNCIELLKTDYEIDDPNIINIQKVKDSIVVGYLFNDGESMGYLVFTQKRNNIYSLLECRQDEYIEPFSNAIKTYVVGIQDKNICDAYIIIISNNPRLKKIELRKQIGQIDNDTKNILIENNPSMTIFRFSNKLEYNFFDKSDNIIHYF